MSKLTNRDGHPYKSPDAPAPAPALDVRILKAENDAMWELATSRQREIDALTAQLAERDTTTQKVLNYWYPRLGYANANAMVYPPLEDRRAKEAPSLAERDDLRAKLAERDERFARMVELQGDLRDKLGERIAHLEAKLAAAEHRIAAYEHGMTTEQTMSDNKAIAKLETTTLQDMQRGLRYCKLRETMAGPLTPARRDELRKARPISVHHARQWLDELLDAHDALARDLDVAREALEQTSQCPTCKGTGVFDFVVGAHGTDHELIESGECPECDGLKIGMHVTEGSHRALLALARLGEK